ncbi:hypothetical protein [Aeromonas salmonicida]|uniref:hypothetical protein n=1 Tax=Aeromonas salmonicida TaxID=645 RepID=UPI0038BD98D9
MFRVFIVALCLIPLLSYGSEAFLNTAEKQFESLLELLPDDEKSKWKQREFEEIMDYSQRLNKLKETHDLLRNQSDYNDMYDVLAFSYLANANRYKLDSKVALVNDLGLQLYRAYETNNLNPLRKTIEEELVGLQNTSGALQLQSQLTKYFKLQREIEELLKNPPIKMELEYRPQDNAWDSDPELVKKYVLFDWLRALTSLKEKTFELQTIKDNFASFNYLKLKDPIAFVSLGVQLAILLVAVAGYLISYTEKPSVTVVASLVIASMLVSVLLVFVSSSTIFNLLVQAIIPGAFISYWVHHNSHNKNMQQPADGGG